jgi:phospholipid/cholesterol/gamma-HCH transport system ATP-binding protein
LISIRNIYKSFNDLQVLSDVSLEIGRGETVVVIGESGCGKTVLLKHMIGLLKPDLGEVFFDGEDIARMNEKELNQVRRRFGMLFQGAALFDSLNVFENVGFALREHTKESEEKIRQIVREKLALVGLEGIEDKMPLELSGGMKKRVGLARAIVLEPEVILYDEPTTGLDPVRGDTINELILKMHHTLKVTTVAVTHDMKSAYKIADRIAMLHQGKIIAEGTPEEIKNTRDEIVARFIEGRAEKLPLGL